MTLKISYALAHAAALDAANAQMKREGRLKWSLEDYDLAASTLNALLPDAELAVPALKCPQAIEQEILIHEISWSDAKILGAWLTKTGEVK